MKSFSVRLLAEGYAGLITRRTAEQARAFVAEARLLDRVEMQELFPHCTIVSERVLGLTKSYVAVR